MHLLHNSRAICVHLLKYTLYTYRGVACAVNLLYISRLTIVSREAKKSQRPLSELFTRNTAKKLATVLAKPPRQLAHSYHSSNTFLLHRISKPTMVEIGATVLKYWPLRV